MYVKEIGGLLFWLWTGTVVGSYEHSYDSSSSSSSINGKNYLIR
jgi:hypothetical protein